MVLFRQRTAFLCAFALVSVASVIYALVGTTYEAKMKILVRRGRADAPASAQVDAPLDLTRMTVTEEDLNSEAELLSDDEVLRKVAEANGLGNHDWLHFLRPREGDHARLERAARRLAKKLKVEAIKKTNLISVRYSADDPQRAASVLKSVADAYLQKHTVVHRPGGELPFFDQQRGESRLQLEEAKGKLLQFTTRHNVVSAAQERDLALRKLSDLNAARGQTHIELVETQQRVAQLESLLKQLPERTTTLVRIADNPELQKSLKSTLLELQLKRTQLLTKFEPSHRLVQELDQQIAQAENSISAEVAQPLRDETTDKNTHYEWAKSELQLAQVQLKALQARESATIKQEAVYKMAAQRLGEDAITQDDLESSEKAAQETYLLYVKKEEEARMDDALDQRGIVDVAIAQAPVAPALPIYSPWTVVLVGIVAAGASGVSAAFVADHLSPVFRDPDDVIACLAIPVLASLPTQGRARMRA